MAVWWKIHELDVLAAEFVKLRSRGMKKGEAVSKCQLGLPINRRRNVQFSTMPVYWRTKVEELAQGTDSMPSCSEVVDRIQSRMGVIAQEQAEERMIAKIMEQLKPMIAAEVECAMNKARPSYLKVLDARKHNPEPVQEDRQRKPRIVIVGMLTKQLRLLIEEYKALSFRVITESATPKDVKNVCESADVVLGMTDFMAHTLERQVIQASRPGIYTRVTGCMTAFRKELSRIDILLKQAQVAHHV